MKVDYLIIPMDSRTSGALATAMDGHGHEVTKRLSVLAQWLNLKTLRSLDESELKSLRRGVLLHHKLGLFRRRVQRLDESRKEDADASLIVDPLLVLVSPLWITTVNPKHVFLVHGGLDSIANDLKTGRCDDDQSCNYTELAGALIDEINSKFPADCSRQVIELDAEQAPGLLDAKRLSVIQKDTDRNTCGGFSSSGSSIGSGRWLAWELMESRFDLTSSDESMDFHHQYRMLERKVLKGRVSGKRSAGRGSKSTGKHDKDHGGHQQGRVRSYGRRVRYAFQMLFSGRLK